METRNVLIQDVGVGGDLWRQKLLAIQDRIAACCLPPLERRDAAEHRRHILAVARHLVTQHGVDEVSMHQIAQAAGVGQGTLYRRFAHKGELCMALLAENVAQVQLELRAYLASCSESTPAREQLDYVLSRHVAFNEENARLLSVVVEAACGNRRAGQYSNPFFMAIHETVETLLQRAVARGEMPPLDTAYMTDAILSTLAIDLYIYQRTERGFTPERIMQGIRQLYIEGIRAGASAATAAE